MKPKNLSFPIDPRLAQAIRRDVRDKQVSQADVVRLILRQHYGLLKSKSCA